MRNNIIKGLTHTFSSFFILKKVMMCGSAGEIDNGQYVYTGVDFGDTATAVCDEGWANMYCNVIFTVILYTFKDSPFLNTWLWAHPSIRYRLVGQEIRNCLSAGWDGHAPACEGEVNHGGVTRLPLCPLFDVLTALYLFQLWFVESLRRLTQRWEAVTSRLTHTGVLCATVVVWDTWRDRGRFGAPVTGHGVLLLQHAEVVRPISDTALFEII